jgi:hypothetical protein
MVVAASTVGASQVDALGAQTVAGRATAVGHSRYLRWDGMAVENLDPVIAHAATDGATPVSPPQETQTITLSNERTFTRWANPSGRAPIYAGPSRFARTVGRLHMSTEDGFPEVYVLLSEYTNASGRQWVEVRIPARPNGETGWVRRGALGPFEISRWLLVVDREARRMTVYHNGLRRFSAPVGVGKPTTPTPAGEFWIRERFRVLDSSSPYWPYAMGTSDYSSLSEWPGGGVVGIHGDWGQPWLIPGDPSHGCIRLHNADDTWVVTHVPVGTPLRIV